MKPKPTHACPYCGTTFSVLPRALWVGHTCPQVPTTVARRDGTFVVAEPILVEVDA